MLRSQCGKHVPCLHCEHDEQQFLLAINAVKLMQNTLLCMLSAAPTLTMRSLCRSMLRPDNTNVNCTHTACTCFCIAQNKHKCIVEGCLKGNEAMCLSVSEPVMYVHNRKVTSVDLVREVRIRYNVQTS